MSVSAGPFPGGRRASWRLPASLRSLRDPRRSLLLVLAAGLAALALGGCGGGDDPPGAAGQTAGRPATADSTAGAAATPAPPGRGGRPGGPPAMAAVPVAVAPAEVGDIASYYRTTATLEAEKEAQVLARVGGLVQRILVEEGDRVREGDPLLEIENDEYRLRLQQAEATTANVRSRYERMQQMIEEGLATEEEFQTAHSDLENAEAEEGLARLLVGYTTVRAPFDGAVVERLVDPGQNVSEGTPVFLLSDFDPLLALFHVPAKEFRSLRSDQPVTLVLDSDGTRLEGTIKLISPVIDPTSGTIKITVEIPAYPDGTRPGDFAEVQVVTERHLGTTLVPRGAVLAEKGENVAYVAVDGRAERRIVEVGFTDLDNAEILTGVAPGELVVVKGQRSLKNGMPLKILADEQAALAAGAEG